MAEMIRNRNEIESRYKWDLTHIYPSDAAWQEDYDRISGFLTGRISEFRGKVAENPKIIVIICNTTKTKGA